MSGFEAIGAAAAILQFVDFASKLLVTGYDIYKSQAGATPQAIHTQSLCTELQSISAQLDQAPLRRNTLNDREQSLWRLANQAHVLALHLGLLLDSLKLKKATFDSWDALRQSWRVLHQKDRIARMTTQLDEIKSLIDTNLLVLLRDDTSLLIRLVNEQTLQSKHMHGDSISALQSLKHDLLTTMQQHRDSALQSHDMLLRKIGDQLANLAQRCTAHEKAERILESLYCEEVHNRARAVSDAANCTFDWAFNAWCPGNCLDCGCRCTGSVDRTSEYRCSDHAGSLQCPCSGLASHQKHLLRWLENNASEPFVVTGKPGSGKSTFMKFIAGHEQTRQALAGWAGDQNLLVAIFYFWSSGSPLQRSQEGLLRCLLYQILSQAQELIPTAASKRWQTPGDSPRITEPWTRREISDAFSGIVNGNSLNVNICFFIDGLDEHGGSDLANGGSNLELVSELKKLASSPHIKLCLSSRPRTVFENHLISDESHHITLHHHTEKDIEQFVHSRFKRVRPLIDIEDTDLKKLQLMIVARSSGVFLWVVLVVRELLDGLVPPFSVSEMKQRLLLLPKSLNDYFQKILNKVHQQYRRFTARLLLMSMHEDHLDADTAHFLWILDQEDMDSHRATVLQQRQSYTLPQDWQNDTCLRIRKCCGDLLDATINVAFPYITHTHRSVADFLKLPEVRSQLLTNAGWQVFDIHLAFCRTYVSGFEHGVFRNKLTAGGKFEKFMLHASKYEFYSGKACSDLVHKLDSVPSSRSQATENHFSWDELLFQTCFPTMAISDAHALLLRATIYGLHLFVDQTTQLLEPQATVAALNCLLRALVLGCYHPHLNFSGISIVSDAVAFLCGKGANPNDIVRTPFSCTADHKTATLTWTIWELYLRQVSFESSHDEYVFFDSHEDGDINKYCVMDRLIEGGADLECKMPVGCTSLEQAIERRLEKDYHIRWYDTQGGIRLERLKRVKTVLLRRGYIWEEAADPET